MAVQYGKTWWGKQFLNALAQIDYSNRLGRGRTYANKGLVKEIRIEGQTIHARVRGSSTYTVTIAVPGFKKNQINDFISEIARHPLLITSLLNHELDPRILDIAQKAGLQIFPRKWSDFKMKCSCPDWAVPCKHLAAVLYMVSREVDSNPFILFQLRGIDPVSELEKHGVHIGGVIDNQITGITEWFNPVAKKKKSEEEVYSEKERVWHDFSGIDDHRDFLTKMLSPLPVFYHGKGDFRDSCRAALKEAASIAAVMLGAAQCTPAIRRKMPAGWDAPEVLFDRHLAHDMSIDFKTMNLVVSNAAGGHLDASAAMFSLLHISSDTVDDYHVSTRVLRETLLLAMNLTFKGAIVPGIFAAHKGTFCVRWMPAMMLEQVARIIEKLEPDMPDNILLCGATKQAGRDVALHLVSCWITCFLNTLAAADQSRSMQALFFGGMLMTFNKPGEEQIPGGIQSWLAPLHFTCGRFRPVLMIDEAEKDHFHIHAAVRTKDALEAAPSRIADIAADVQQQQYLFEILQSLERLTQFVPGFADHINSRCVEPVRLNGRDVAVFLAEIVPAIKALNVEVLLDTRLKNLLRPAPLLSVRTKAEKGTGALRLDALLDFEWQVALGDTRMPASEFMKLVRNKEGVIRCKAGYICMSADEITRLEKMISTGSKVTNEELLRAALAGEFNGADVAVEKDAAARITDFSRWHDVDVPAAIEATLRPYQKRGFSWLIKNARAGFGSLIADDMGLGKTLQVIAMMQHFKDAGDLEKEKILVVVPAGLLANWQRECARFAKNLRVHLYHGAAREFADTEWDVLLTTYGVVRSEQDILKKIHWHTVIIDEAQNIKNPDAAQARAVCALKSRHTVAMTGTPVENRLMELWSVMHFCNRGLLGSAKSFREKFANPVQFGQDKQAALKLKRITAPFLLRRMKTDPAIITDLPAKVEIDNYCAMAVGQAALYQRTLQAALEAIEKISRNDKAALFKRQGLVLQMILALKQICNHPSQFLKQKNTDPALSGKSELLLELLDTIDESGEKVLVFTQFRETGVMLQQMIEDRFGEQPLFYHGGCSVKARNGMVQAFQHDHARKVLILSLKAGGTGLNLTAASRVIHYDLWWNPAVEAQATDRAYRIGQTQRVMVHRLLTRGSFEEKINELLSTKKNLAEMTVASGETWIGNLDNDQLRDIFRLDGE